MNALNRKEKGLANVNMQRGMFEENKTDFVRRVFFTYSHISPNLLRELIEYAAELYDKEKNSVKREQQILAKGKLCAWISPLLNKVKSHNLI